MRRKGRGRVGVSVVLVLMGLAVWLGVPRLARPLYQWLDVSVPPVPADALLVLGGNESRAFYAAQLYRDGVVPVVIINGPWPIVGRFITVLREADVPAHAILPLCCPTDTYAEVGQGLALLRTLDVQHVLVLTDRPHTRRVRASFARLAQPGDPALTFTAMHADGQHVYWLSRGGRAPVLSELPKLAVFALRWRVNPWAVPN